MNERQFVCYHLLRSDIFFPFQISSPIPLTTIKSCLVAETLCKAYVTKLKKNSLHLQTKAF